MEKILATEQDFKNLDKILKIIASLETTDMEHIDFENAELQFTIMRVEQNLKNGSEYYKPVPDEEKQQWYDANCSGCGWFGSSKYCRGGGQIADTGDYNDPTCPICDKPID